jgi:hypothetical protein
MEDNPLRRARDLTSKGFYYDNLIEMANICLEENHPEKILSAYILNRFFSQLADEIGDGPIMSIELRKLEARYRTAVNHVLEKAMADASQDVQSQRCIDLIQLLWTAP